MNLRRSACFSVNGVSLLTASLKISFSIAKNAKYKDSIKHYIRNKRHAIESCRAKLSERHDQCR